jgi:hypothetical protein
MCGNPRYRPDDHAVKGFLHAMNKLVVTCIVTVLTLFSNTSGRAVVVYQESCPVSAFESWDLTCKIDKNTFQNAGPNDFWADSFKEIQSITICAGFDNHGGLAVPIIVHNYRGGGSKPTDLFDTVKFQGNLVAGKFSWVGSGPRRDYLPSSASTWTMRGQLHGGGEPSPTYTEILSNAHRTIGEIQATCSDLKDQRI